MNDIYIIKALPYSNKFYKNDGSGIIQFSSEDIANNPQLQTQIWCLASYDFVFPLGDNSKLLSFLLVTQQ